MIPLFGHRPATTLARQPLAHRWAIALAFSAAYLLLDQASFLYPMPVFNVTPWNPQPSLAIAFLLIAGQRRIWVVFATLAVAELVIRDAVPSPASALLVSAVLALGYAAMASALSGRYQIAIALRQRTDVLRLLAVVVAGSLFIGAFYIAAVAITRAESGNVAAAWLRFWIGDTVGIVVTLPLILMLIDTGRRRQILALLRKPEMMLQLAAVVASLLLVFAAAGAQPVKFFYLLFLPLIWIAGRHGMAGTAPAMVVLQVGVVIGMSVVGFSTLPVFELQALLLALAITGFFVAVTVDERQRVSDDLRRSLKLAAAGEMAAAITHELNQPLTALANYARACQLIVEADPGPGSAALGPTLDKVSAEARRAGDVIRRLRDLFQGGVGKRERLSLAALVDGVVANFRLRHSDLDLAWSLPADPVWVEGDRVQLELVLRNLLQNAVDALAGAAERHVAVRLTVVRRHVRVDVTDSGPGIPAQRLAQIFEPFVSEKASGMGVGLPMSRAIVEAHGGQLVAEAGSGGRLHFTLPRATP